MQKQFSHPHFLAEHPAIPGHSSLRGSKRRRHNDAGSSDSPLRDAEHLRSGVVLIYRLLHQDWLKAQESGRSTSSREPLEETGVESFHDKLRDECLSRNSSAICRGARYLKLACRIQ
jgi:hypothetical protein